MTIISVDGWMAGRLGDSRFVEDRVKYTCQVVHRSPPKRARRDGSCKPAPPRMALRASRTTPATPLRVSSVEAWRTWRPRPLFLEPCVSLQFGSRVYVGCIEAFMSKPAANHRNVNLAVTRLTGVACLNLCGETRLLNSEGYRENPPKACRDPCDPLDRPDERGATTVVRPDQHSMPGCHRLRQIALAFRTALKAGESGKLRQWIEGARRCEYGAWSASLMA